MKPHLSLPSILIFITQTLALSVKPFLSRSGDSAILVFLDIHDRYHGDACSAPNWNTFEIAHQLYWTSLQNNATGNAIYAL